MLGKLIRANNHVEYIGQIYGPGEVEHLPNPIDYALGTFVRLKLATTASSWLVGAIHDTWLYNPTIGLLGPRLSANRDLPFFTPDYLNEKAILIGIYALGTLHTQGQADQRLPVLAAMTDTEIEPLSPEEIMRFHQRGNRLQLSYAGRLLTRGQADLLNVILSRLQQLPFTPQQQTLITLLRQQLAWQQHIIPFGGE